MLGRRCTGLRVTPRSQGVGFFRVCLRKFSRELGKGVIIAWQVLGCTLLMFSTFPVFSWGRRPFIRVLDVLPVVLEFFFSWWQEFAVV